MADRKISELSNITGSNVADTDEFVLVDTSADETKAITASELRTAIGNGDFTVTGDLTVQGTTITVDSATAQNIVLGDNDKMTFGAGSDLQIYHDGTHSRIYDTGTGNLILQGSSAIVFNAVTNGEHGRVTDGGGWALGYNGSTKFATNSSGVDVTGTLTTDGLTVESSGNNYARINSTDSNTRLYLDRGSVSSRSQIIMQTSGAETGGAWAFGMWDDETFRIEDWTGTDTTRLTIDANGNVKIGTDTDQTSFLTETTANLQIGGGLLFEAGSGNNAEILNYRTTAMVFGNGGTEDMRIDSSGNLLVGKTSAAYNTDGFETHPNGETYVSRSGTPMAINRNSSNGTLLNFYKDGTTVGSIGTFSGDLVIGSANNTAIYFESDRILPVNTSNATVRDNTVNLGQSTSRFKDLYLSGGVYLGGTGSSNLQDDYETGTWNVTDGSGAGLSFTVLSNVYTKVGRLVVATANVLWPSTSNTSLARLVLPFTASPNGSATGGVVTEDNYSSSQTLTAAVNYSNGVIFRTNGLSGLTNANLSGKRLRFTITYHHG